MKTQFAVYRCTKILNDRIYDNNYNFLVFRFTRSKFSKVFLLYHTCLYIYKDQHEGAITNIQRNWQHWAHNTL